MQPNTPNEPKVPEVKQGDLFEGQDIPYTPPPKVEAETEPTFTIVDGYLQHMNPDLSISMVRLGDNRAFGIDFRENKFVKKDKIQLESDKLTDCHAFHCAHCGYMELYSCSYFLAEWFAKEATGFTCRKCWSHNNLEHYQEELRKREGLPPSWTT